MVILVILCVTGAPINSILFLVYDRVLPKKFYFDRFYFHKTWINYNKLLLFFHVVVFVVL